MRKHISRLIFLLILAFLVIFYVAIPLARLYQSTHPLFVSSPQGSLADRGLPYMSVTFQSNDGIHLVGWYIPSKNRAAIILVHGFNGNRNGLMDQAEFLARRGFGILAFDLRDHGDSQQTMYTRGWLEVNDLLGAIAYLRTQTDIDADRIGVLGSSIGGLIALQTTAMTTQIKAVAVEGAVGSTFEDEPAPVTLGDYLNYPATWVFFQALALTTGVQAPRPISAVIPTISPRPLLLISAGQDHEQRQNRKFFAAAEEPKILWEIPETTHTAGLSARPEEYRQRLIGFFEDALLGPTF